MYRSRVSLGSLAATTAMICVLSLTPPVVSVDGGFFNLPLAQAQCCFTAGTHVLMADGTEHPINGIRPGDQVIGRTGGVNRVASMHIVPLGPHALFGINQQLPFFTDEHPFLTPDGWRSLDRAATRQETPGLEVAELTAGDVLITAAAVSGETTGAPALTPAVSFGSLVLHEITRVEGNPADYVYNLILDGDHSYVANNFIVHNKGGEGGQGGGEGGQGGGGQGGGGQSSGGSGQGGGQGGGQGNGQGKSNAARGNAANATTVAAGTTPVDPDVTENNAASPTATDEDSNTDTTGATSGEFSGSAAPASPDLSTTEEKDVISNGWK